MIAVQHRAAPGGNAAGTGLREGDKMQITDGKDYIPQVRELIREYTDALGRDLRDEAAVRLPGGAGKASGQRPCRGDRRPRAAGGIPGDGA